MDSRVAAFKAFQASPISSKTWAFCSCKAGTSGANARAASHLPSASRYFPSYKKEYGINYKVQALTQNDMGTHQISKIVGQKNDINLNL